MTTTQNLGVLLVMLVFAGLEFASGRSKRLRATIDDSAIEFLALVLLVAVVQPLVFVVVHKLCVWAIPRHRAAWAQWPWWAMTLVLLVGDDMLQYWWHRASHTKLLWPLHRAHHSAAYMSIRITYRNNAFYYLMMPSIWVSGLLIYLGLAGAYVTYVIVKMTVILGAHSAVRWDEPLYRRGWLRPIAWLVERTISTPATHWAHHARTNADGVGHYIGNFGNLLFVWDILFGTAKITRRYPAEVGLQDDVLYGRERWFVEIFYPLFHSRRAHSALVPGGHGFTEDTLGSSLPTVNLD